MYVCTHVCMYVRTYIHTYVNTHVRAYLCMYACMYVCAYVRTYVHILEALIIVPDSISRTSLHKPYLAGAPHKLCIKTNALLSRTWFVSGSACMFVPGYTCLIPGHFRFLSFMASRWLPWGPNMLPGTLRLTLVKLMYSERLDLS